MSEDEQWLLGKIAEALKEIRNSSNPRWVWRRKRRYLKSLLVVYRYTGAQPDQGDCPERM